MEAGLVRDDKRGVQIFYRLQCPCVLDFLGCIETMERSTAKARWRIARIHANEEPARVGTSG